MGFIALVALLLLSIERPGLDGVDRTSEAVRHRLAKVPKASRGPSHSRTLRHLDAGRVYLALHESEQAWLRPAAERFVRDNSEVRSAAEFRLRWGRVEESLAPPRFTDGLPLVVRALSTAAYTRCGPTLRGSLPYAEEIDLRDGLYYLGEAHALHDLAEFYASAPMRVGTPPPSVRPMAAAIDELARTVAQMHASADARSRPAFIPIAVALTLARTLDAQGERAAALVQYLLARYQAALLVTPPTAAEGTASRLASLRLPDGVDHSIAALFLQMAEAHLGDELPPGPRGAAAIVDRVLPAYLEAISP